MLLSFLANQAVEALGSMQKVVKVMLRMKEITDLENQI